MCGSLPCVPAFATDGEPSRHVSGAECIRLNPADAQTKDFPGIAGAITLDEKRNAVKPAVVLKVGDGKSEYVTTVSP